MVIFTYSCTCLYACNIQNILIYEFTSDGYKSNNGILKPFIGYWIYSDEERTIII